MSSREQEAGIPFATRAEVIERDGNCCRLCGRWVEVPHVHHLIYRSQGGQNYLNNLVSLDFGCHGVVHSNKNLWLPVMTTVVVTPGVTGRQLLRWARARGAA